MLGNAVPSLMAEVLAWEIRRQLLGLGERPTAFKLIPPQRRPLPDPEPLQPVPAKYLPLVAEHADHPGERTRKRVERVSQAGLFDAAAEVWT